MASPNLGFRGGRGSASVLDPHVITDEEYQIAERASLAMWLDFRSLFVDVENRALVCQDRAPNGGGRRLRTFGPGALPTIGTDGDIPCLIFGGTDVGIAGKLKTDLTVNKTQGTFVLVYRPTKATTQAIIGSHQGAGETNADLVANVGFTNSGSNNQIPRFFDGNFNNRAFANLEYQNTAHVFMWDWHATNGIFLKVDGVQKVAATTGIALGGLTDGAFQVGRGFESSSNKVRMAKGPLFRAFAFNESLRLDPEFEAVVLADALRFKPAA